MFNKARQSRAPRILRSAQPQNSRVCETENTGAPPRQSPAARGPVPCAHHLPGPVTAPSALLRGITQDSESRPSPPEAPESPRTTRISPIRKAPGLSQMRLP